MPYETTLVLEMADWCPSCEKVLESVEESPLYYCKGCDKNHGEDGGKCPECNKKSKKIADRHCECMEEIDESEVVVCPECGEQHLEQNFVEHARDCLGPHIRAAWAEDELQNIPAMGPITKTCALEWVIAIRCAGCKELVDESDFTNHAEECSQIEEDNDLVGAWVDAALAAADTKKKAAKEAAEKVKTEAPKPVA